MVSKALLDAERNVGNLLTGSLTSVQCGLLDSLLLQHNAGRISILAWIRQPPGRPGRRAFAEILERLSTLRAIGLEPVLLIAWLMPIVTLGLAPGLEAFLAFLPGGQAEMTVIAIIAGADLAYVVSHHLLRIMIVILLAPIVARLFRRRE